MVVSFRPAVIVALWPFCACTTAAFTPSRSQLVNVGSAVRFNGVERNILPARGARRNLSPDPNVEEKSVDPARNVFSSKNEAANKAKALNEQARRASLEAERLEAELTLEKIEKLERALRISDESAGDGKKKSDIRAEIETLVKKIDPTLALSSDESGMNSAVDGTTSSRDLLTTFTAKVPLSVQELEDAVAYFNSLPIALRITLAEVVDLDYEDGAEKVIMKLYEKLDTLSPSEIREYYVEGSKKPTQEEVKELIFDFEDAMMMETSVDSQIPRQARKEGKAPSSADVKAFFAEVCGKDTFQPSEQPLKAGEVWVIRGTNTRKNAQELVDEMTRKLEAKIPSWSSTNQFCYVNDPSLQEGVEDIFGDPVILIVNKDMSPSANNLLVSAATAAGLFGSFLFSLATFGANPIIMDRLQEASAAGDYDLAWFNELLFPLLASFATIQFSHEMAHQVVAWRDSMKVTPPVILPSTGLPYLTFLRRIKTPPKNFDSLFDFGFAGPVTGIVASMGFLLYGLQLTTTMDPETAKYLPGLPVAFVKLSSLGGTLVDQVVGSGTGMLLNQDPTAQVPLHPFAVAGYIGLMINALDLIPIGSSDGARVMQSMLGRVGQTVVSGFVYIALLFALIFIDDQKDIFLSFGIMSTFVHRDLEILCQNEIDKVGLTKATAALGAFFVAALILVPLS